MLFNSFHFLAFFPVVVAVYFVLPHRVRWVWLLVASYYFYMAWRPAYVLLLWLITGIDYLSGLALGAARGKATRVAFLSLSLASNLSLLFAFKYLDFFAESVAAGLGLAGVAYRAPVFDLVLPLGISFHTFQALSYTIDVYGGRKEPERHLGVFALYIAFFPQLVAGPIERATHLLPQFFERHGFVYGRVVSGLRLMLWGFFKKLVIADRVAIYVNEVYADPSSHSASRLALATIFFAYQIYCDFSGYSDIAIGAARVMGFDLAPNFRRPYHAASVRDFWHRWHISLSTWFRDYLYIPLGGNRVGAAHRWLNLFVVFVLSGLWHGASWTFVIWGALHGLYVVASTATKPLRERVFGPAATGGLARRVASVALTFFLVAFAWIFFRAESLADATTVIVRIASGADGAQSPLLPAFGEVELALAIVFIVAMQLVESLEARWDAGERFTSLPTWARWACYYLLVLVVLLFGKFDEREFIYFQF